MRRLTKDEKRQRKAATLQLFVKKYARKTRPGMDPNDRTYDPEVQQQAKRLPPEELDRLLRDGEDED